MLEIQNTQETEDLKEKIPTPKDNITQEDDKQQKAPRKSRPFIRYALLANLILTAFAISEVLLIKLAIWTAGSTFGIDEASQEYLNAIVHKSAFSGFMAYHILYQVRSTSIEKVVKAFLHKHSFDKRKLRQGIGLGIAISFIAISMIAIKDGAVLRLASIAFTLVFVLVSLSVGFFCAKSATYFFIKDTRAILDASNN